jgi:Zn-finger nucleic acid-binding protein
MSNVRAHMSSPLCPNCLERMSATEAGMGGVWSCLYCEATWLPAHRVSSLLGVVEASRSVPESSTLAHAPSPTHGMLVCPQCHAKSFHLLTSAPSEAYLCVTCSSVFLQRGVLAMLAPEAAARQMEAPAALVVMGTVASVLLLDPTPLIHALYGPGLTKSAP